MYILRFSFNFKKLLTEQVYAAADCITVIDGSHSLIRHMMLKSSGKIMYDTGSVHKVTNLKN